MSLHVRARAEALASDQVLQKRHRRRANLNCGWRQVVRLGTKAEPHYMNQNLRPLQRSSLLDLLDISPALRPEGNVLQDAAWRDAVLETEGLKVLGMETQGRSLMATEVATSCN